MKSNKKKKRQRSGMNPSKAGGRALQMLQRSNDADNVLPRLPQGLRLQWRVLIWVSSELVLQGSAVLAVVLLASAVSHLLVTSHGCIGSLNTTESTYMIRCTVPYLHCHDRLICTEYYFDEVCMKLDLIELINSLLSSLGTFNCKGKILP